MVLTAPYRPRERPFELMGFPQSPTPSGSPAKRTPVRYSPCGGAVGPAARAVRAASSVAGVAHGSPRAGQQHRADQRPHLVAQEARRRRSRTAARRPPSCQAAWCTVRTNVRCCVSVGVNAVKSCAPTTAAAHASSTAGRAAPRWCSARRASSALGVAHHPHAVHVGAGAGRVAGVEARPAPRRRRARRRRPAAPRSAPAPRWRPAGRRRPDADDLAERVHAGVGAAGDRAGRSPARIPRVERRRERPLHRPQRRAAAPSRGTRCRRTDERQRGGSPGSGRCGRAAASRPPPRATRTQAEQRQHRRHDQVRRRRRCGPRSRRRRACRAAGPARRGAWRGPSRSSDAADELEHGDRRRDGVRGRRQAPVVEVGGRCRRGRASFSTPAAMKTSADRDPQQRQDDAPHGYLRRRRVRCRSAARARGRSARRARRAASATSQSPRGVADGGEAPPGRAGDVGVVGQRA